MNDKNDQAEQSTIENTEHELIVMVAVPHSVNVEALTREEAKANLQEQIDNESLDDLDHWESGFYFEFGFPKMEILDVLPEQLISRY